MYYKVSEVSQMFNIGKTTVRTWISQRKIFALKMGDVYRIPESEIARIKSSGIQGTPDNNLSVLSCRRKSRARPNTGGRRPWEK